MINVGLIKCLSRTYLSCNFREDGGRNNFNLKTRTAVNSSSEFHPAPEEPYSKLRSDLKREREIRGNQSKKRRKADVGPARGSISLVAAGKSALYTLAHSRRAESFLLALGFMPVSVAPALFSPRLFPTTSRGTLFFPAPPWLPRGMSTVCINEHAPPPASYYPHPVRAATGTPGLFATLSVQPVNVISRVAFPSRFLTCSFTSSFDTRRAVSFIRHPYRCSTRRRFPLSTNLRRIST